MMQPLVFNGVAQRARDRLLAGDFFKSLWAPFARDDLIRHETLLFSFVSRQLGYGIFLQELPRNDNATISIFSHYSESDEDI